MGQTGGSPQPFLSAKLLKQHQITQRLRGSVATGGVITALKRSILFLLAISLLGRLPVVSGMALESDEERQGAAIIDRYLEATRGHADDLRGASMEVEIKANVPKLKENGTLKALRKISKVGQITYRFLSFQGDNTVKSQVIVRYLQAEQQGQGDSNIAISQQNYKFKYKGLKQTEDGVQGYVFQLSPRKKKVGLFKGELWIDAHTYLPLVERGRLVKNPSIFFKKVDFERDFAIHNGLSIPSRIMSVIDTRLIGKVELLINYSKYTADASPTETGETSTDTTSESVAFHPNLCQ